MSYSLLKRAHYILFLHVKSLKNYQFSYFHSLYGTRVILKMKHSLVVTKHSWSGSRVKPKWNLPVSVLWRFYRNFISFLKILVREHRQLPSQESGRLSEFVKKGKIRELSSKRFWQMISAELKANVNQQESK